MKKQQDFQLTKTARGSNVYLVHLTQSFWLARTHGKSHENDIITSREIKQQDDQQFCCTCVSLHVLASHRTLHYIYKSWHGCTARTLQPIFVAVLRYPGYDWLTSQDILMGKNNAISVSNCRNQAKVALYFERFKTLFHVAEMDLQGLEPWTYRMQSDRSTTGAPNPMIDP